LDANQSNTRRRDLDVIKSLSISECENVAISRYFKIHKALKNKVLKAAIHMRLLINRLIRILSK